MATIYSAPNSLNPPIFTNFFKSGSFDDEGYKKAEDGFVDRLKAFLIKRKAGENVGEVIGFPVADGQAQYMVASMQPLELVHVPLNDAYEFEYAYLLTTKEVQQKIDQNKFVER